MAERPVRIITKRTAVPGKIPTGTTGTELNLIKAGELASNLADKKLFSYDGSNVFEFGSKSFLGLTGGTVSGETTFQSGITVNTISDTNYVDFNTSPSVPSPTGGTLYYDSSENALSYKPLTNQNDVTVNLGQESLVRVYNNSGAQINNGQVVHITGSTSGTPTVALANASKLGTTFIDGLAQSSGVATHNIPNGEYGFITSFGIVRDLDTSTFIVGRELFLSDTIDGGITDDPDSIAFTSRISVLGWCLTSDAVNGKIYVKIENENQVQSLTQQEVNVLLGNTISTGVYEYTGATTASTTTFNVAPMRGWLVSNTYSNATNPDVINVYYTGGTNISLTNIGSADSTYLLVNSGATLYQQTTFPTPQQRRENIYLGKVNHPNRTSILNINNTVDYDVSPMSSLRDLWSPIRLINQGIIPSPNGANLSFNTSAGSLWGNGINWSNNQLSPNNVNIAAKVPASFTYRTQTGGTSSSVTVIDPTKYDIGGVITSISPAGSNDATNQRIYLYPTGVINVLYGQTRYATLVQAISAIQSETFIPYPNAESTGILIGVISVRNDIVADGQPLTNPDYAKFTLVSKFGESFGGTGGLSTTTLQQAYNNSTNPEIITNTTLGGVQFKGGTGNDADKNIIIENNSSVETAYIRADGKALFNTISATTIGDSGSCVTNLYVSNISSCSPLNIQPNNGGNVYFGPTSAITIDLSNNRLGIGTPNPEYRLDISGTTGRVFYDGDTTRNTYRQSQIINEGPSTGITAISVASEGSGNQIELFSIGSGVSNSIQWRFAGEPGDVALYASSAANNLNIINNVGSGTADNIRFYAGGSGHITGQTPAMHIQGSGSTKGYVGIGTVTPTAKLHVTNTGSSDSFLVEDSTNPDSTPFVIDRFGRVGIGIINPSTDLHISGNAAAFRLQGTDHIYQEFYPQGSTTRFGFLGYGSSGSSDLELFNESSAGRLKFGTSGLTRMVISASGDLGIGITSPTAKLHINNTTSGNTFLAEDSTNPDSSPFVIDSSGQVGIGTTTPSEKLNISGNTKIDVITSGTTDGLIINKSGSFTRGQIVLTDDNNLLWRFGLTSGGGNTSFNFFNGANDVLTINRDFEQVGIGVNPSTVGTQAKLHINNTTSGNTFLAEDSTNPDSSPFVIDSSGQVGIGLTTPSLPLHIRASAVASTNEPIVRVQVSDSDAYFAINNAVTTDSVFVPEVLGRGDSTNSQIGIVIGAYIDSTQDVGTSPVTVFRSGLASIANVTTRPLFDFRNLSTSVMLIDANGDLGIGTSNPTSRLTVVTSSGVTGSYPANSGTLQTGEVTRLRNGGSNLVFDIGGFSSNGNWLQSTNQTDLSLTYPLLLNPNGGKVGINLTSPSESLHVSGNTIVSGTLSGGTMVITTQPTSGYTTTQILMRNTTTGQVEITDSTSPSIYNYGMSYAMTTFNYLT